MKISGNRRKGISPIIATVLIIAATLIAFAAVLGYIFGIFGSAASKADVTVSTQTTFLANTGIPTGTIYFINSGTASTTMSSGTLTFGGGSCSIGPSATSIIPGSTVQITATLTCTGAPTAASGETYTLSLVLADGSSTSYTGTFH